MSIGITMQTKHGDQAQLCYEDTVSFTLHIKSEDVYLDLAEDVEMRFDISNYEVDRPLPRGKKCAQTNEGSIR